MVAVLTVFAWTGIDSAMSFYDAVAQPVTTLPTGGFSTAHVPLEGFGAASQWAIAFFMVVAGVNFALLYRAFFRRQPRVFAPRRGNPPLSRPARPRLRRSSSVELWSEGVLRGEEAIRHSVVNAVSTMTTTGFASDRLQPVAAAGRDRPRRADVRRRLRRLDGRVGQGRPALAPRPHPQAGARPDGAPGSGETASTSTRDPVDERILRAISSFVLLYVGVFAVGTLLLVVDAARVTAVSACSMRSLPPRPPSGMSVPASASRARWARSSRSATSRRS